MRIALVHMRQARTGGTERYLNQLAVHLADLGHEVVIVCRRQEWLPHEAVRFVILSPLALGRAHRMWRFAKAVEHHMAQTEYDVVLGLGKTWTHDVLRLGGGCYQAYLDFVRRTRRGRFVRHLGSQWLRARVALTIEACALAPGAYTRVITNSDMVKRDVIPRYGIPTDKITVIPNGVDLERFHPRHRTGAGAELRRACGFQPEHVVVAFVGTGYYRKGLDRLLQVFPDLIRRRPEARLLVVGHDAALERWKGQARRLGLEAHVSFLGGRRDVEVCYGAGDLYVLPTRYDPFANTTLEALASGMPVITTDANGGCEVIEHGVQGAILRRAAGNDALLRELLQWTQRPYLRQGAQAARAKAEGYSRVHELQASTDALVEVAAIKKRQKGAGFLPRTRPW